MEKQVDTEKFTAKLLEIIKIEGKFLTWVNSCYDRQTWFGFSYFGMIIHINDRIIAVSHTTDKNTRLDIVNTYGMPNYTEPSISVKKLFTIASESYNKQSLNLKKQLLDRVIELQNGNVD